MTTRTLLELETAVMDGHAVVRVDGEIDLGTAPKLRDTLLGLSDEGIYRIDVDLSGAKFMDSTGLAVLIAALRRCQAAGGRLVLLDPSPMAAKVLHATRLSGLFGVDD